MKDRKTVPVVQVECHLASVPTMHRGLFFLDVSHQPQPNVFGL